MNLPAKPLLLAATLASSSACGLFWRRHRYVPMWHLVQAGVLTMLYAALEVLKSGIWRQADWRPTPLFLFGSIFLGAGAIYFVIAAYVRRSAAKVTAATSLETPIRPNAWTLWANIAIGVAFAFSSLAMAFDRGLHTDDFLLVVMLAGTLYGVVAQILDDARLVYVAAGLCLGSGLPLSLSHLHVGASSFGVLFLALSIVALALCEHNRKLSRPASLTTAWKRVGCTAATLGIILVAVQTVLALFGSAALDSHQNLVLQAGLAFGFGLQLLYAAVQETDAVLYYPAVISFGIAPLSLLEALHVHPDRFPLAIGLYAAILLLLYHWTGSKAATNSQRYDWSALGVAGRNCGMAVLVTSLAASSVFAVEHSSSPWILAALILGSVSSGMLSGARTGAAWRYTALSASALSCALLLHIASPITLGFADCMLLFVFVSNLGALATSLTRTKAAPFTSSTGQTYSALWADPLADAGIASGTITLFAAWFQVSGSGGHSHLALVAAVGMVSASLLVASRCITGSDPRRIGALALLNISIALDVAIGVGLTNTGSGNSPEAVHRFALGLLAQGWFFWFLARVLYFFSSGEFWSEDTARVALVPPCLAAILMTASVYRIPPDITITGIPPITLIAGTFALLHVEQMRVRKAHLVPIALGMLLLAALCFLRVPVQAQSYRSITLAAFTIVTSLSYLQLAKRTDRVGVIYLAGVPLIGGVALAMMLSGVHTVVPADIALANATWTIGGIAIALKYIAAARRWNRAELAHIAGVVLTGAYLHGVTSIFHLPFASDGMLLLPLLIGMALVSMSPPRGFEILRTAFLHIAVAISGLAQIMTVLTGEMGIGTAAGRSPYLVTATLGAYAVAYLALTIEKRSPGALAAGATVLTLAYLNLLLSKTSILATGVATLTWPLFAFLLIQSALAWAVVGMALKRFCADKPLAEPIFGLTQVVALASASIAVWSLFTPAQGALGILTVVWAAGIWFGLWALDQGDLCLHVGTGNLMAAWCATIYHTMGNDMNLLDIYLLPFGIYLMGMGHLVSRRQKGSEAQTFWALGLLVTLTPALLTRWTHAPGWHAALLTAECIVCVLWGVSQRIRVFVGAGLGTVILYTASITLGILPDTFTTILALFAGVGLFVFGFYALTHKEAMKRMAATAQQRWSGWHSWR